MPPQIPRAGLSPGDYADWHQQATSFSEMGAHGNTSTGFNLTGDGEPQRVLVGYASSDLLSMLGARVVAGRLLHSRGEPRWQRADSDPGASSEKHNEL